jgi:hypothetical protein
MVGTWPARARMTTGLWPKVVSRTYTSWKQATRTKSPSSKVQQGDCGGRRTEGMNDGTTLPARSCRTEARVAKIRWRRSCGRDESKREAERITYLGRAALLCSWGGVEGKDGDMHRSGWSWMGTGGMGWGVLGRAADDGDWMGMARRRRISSATAARWE